MIPRILSLLLVIKVVNSAGPDDWQGKWFPSNPNSAAKIATSSSSKHNLPMGNFDNECDNAKANLKTDFDPEKIEDAVQYLCLEKRSLFDPSYATQPIVRQYLVPGAYVSLHKCMNTTIEYHDRLPTFGTHRPLWPKYGEYTFVPPQRWVHNLEHGAIVVLYHPCANHKEIEILKMVTKSCLYRYVISASKRLQPDRPLAVVAWGKSLEMSVVDPDLVVDFIKKNGLRGPEKTARDGQYDALLIQSAKIVSDNNDSILCPNIQ